MIFRDYHGQRMSSVVVPSSCTAGGSTVPIPMSNRNGRLRVNSQLGGLLLLVFLPPVNGLVGSGGMGRLRMPSDEQERLSSGGGRRQEQLTDCLSSICPPPGTNKWPSSGGAESMRVPIPFPSADVINWTAMPRESDPHSVTWRSHLPTESGGNLTPRGRRKRAQVENFCQILEPLAHAVAAQKPSSRLVVVDFGSGSGNLLLPLAVRFPQFDFVAVDDKPVALQLLDGRANRMALNNVETWHGRIEAFDRHFDICISLHACGSASDEAIEASIKAQAPYIVSPCCVGKINLKEDASPFSMLARPRSNWLRDQLGPAAGDIYKDIAARADRSETKATAGQRSEDSDGILLSRRCKALVELDRNERAAEGGNFASALLTLRGMDEDYAKLDVLVGVPPSIMGAVVASDDIGSSALFHEFKSSTASKEKCAMSDTEWREKLTTEEFDVLRGGETEPPYFSEKTPGQLEHNLLQTFGHKYPQEGGYRCAGCNSLLFFARSKFGSRCGWPSFWSGVPGAIEERAGDGSDDGENGASKREIVCGRCGGHLGHLFRGEGIRGIPVDSRHCVNGIAINYDEAVEQPATLPSLPRYLRLGAIPP